MTAYIDAIVDSDEWQQATQLPGAFVNCKDILENRVRWGSDYEGATTPEDLIKTLRDDCRKRHKQHVANVHRTYGKDVGLISKRVSISSANVFVG